MIDINTIKENYASKADEDLIHFAKKSGGDLTVEATDALKQEFVRRKLDMSVFQEKEEAKRDELKKELLNTKQEIDDIHKNSIWEYVLKEKEKGTSDNELSKGLIEKGLDINEATLIINSIEAKTNELLKKYEKMYHNGGLVCVIGILITWLTYTMAMNGGAYVVTWGAIIFGGIRCVNGADGKTKCKRILKNVQNKIDTSGRV